MADLNHTTCPLTTAKKCLQSVSVHPAQQLVDGTLTYARDLSLKHGNYDKRTHV